MLLFNILSCLSVNSPELALVNRSQHLKIVGGDVKPTKFCTWLLKQPPEYELYLSDDSTMESKIKVTKVLLFCHWSNQHLIEKSTFRSRDLCRKYANTSGINALYKLVARGNNYRGKWLSLELVSRRVDTHPSSKPH